MPSHGAGFPGPDRSAGSNGTGGRASATARGASRRAICTPAGEVGAQGRVPGRRRDTREPLGPCPAAGRIGSSPEAVHEVPIAGGRRARRHRPGPRTVDRRAIGARPAASSTGPCAAHHVMPCAVAARPPQGPRPGCGRSRTRSRPSAAPPGSRRVPPPAPRPIPSPAVRSELDVRTLVSHHHPHPPGADVDGVRTDRRFCITPPRPAARGGPQRAGRRSRRGGRPVRRTDGEPRAGSHRGEPERRHHGSCFCERRPRFPHCSPPLRRSTPNVVPRVVRVLQPPCCRPTLFFTLRITLVTLCIYTRQVPAPCKCASAKGYWARARVYHGRDRITGSAAWAECVRRRQPATDTSPASYAVMTNCTRPVRPVWSADGSDTSSRSPR